MVFGETTEQYQARKKGPTRVFAWLPRKLEDGRMAWLEPLERTGKCYAGFDHSFWRYSYKLPK